MDNKVQELKTRGLKCASRSLLIRYAIAQLDLDKAFKDLSDQSF